MTGRAGRGRAAVLVGASALLMLAPQTAMAETPEIPEPRAYLPATDAQEIEGKVSSADAPGLEPGGIYTDSIERGETLYYRVSLDDESGAYLSAVAAPELGTKVGRMDTLELELQTTGGDRCDAASRNFSSDNGTRPVSHWVARSIGPDLNCQEAGSYLLKVTRDDDATSSPDPWPLELMFQQEPPVDPLDTRAPSEEGWETEAPPPPSGEPETVSGGTGFNDARPMGEGVWRDQIIAGQTRFYKVPVDWGQQLSLTMELSNARGNDDAGYSMDGILLDMYNPARGLVATDSWVYDGEPWSNGALTPALDFRNRFSSERDLNRVRMAGWHYLALTLHPEVGEEVTEEPVGLTLRVSLLGEPTDGPAYQGEGVGAGFSVTESDLEQAEQALTDEEFASDGQVTKRLIGLVGISVGVLLLGSLAVWQLVARRRGASGPAASPSPPGPPRAA